MARAPPPTAHPMGQLRVFPIPTGNKCLLSKTDGPRGKTFAFCYLRVSQHNAGSLPQGKPCPWKVVSRRRHLR